MRRSVAPALALLLAVGASVPARGYEADQYTGRLLPLEDSRAELNRVVNEALAKIAAGWHGPEKRWRFATRVYWKLGGMFWVHKIERYAMKSPQVDRLPWHRYRSVYTGSPIWASRVIWFFGVAPTIDVAGSRMGTDKLGHFIAQGLKYFWSYLHGKPEARVVHRGQFNERWIFGQATTGVYSNGDLVANYEGYRFYRSLFEDGVDGAKSRIVVFENGRARIARPFDWADHVDDYWDEALNPSFLTPSLQRFMDVRLQTFCGDYAKSPASFVPADDSALAVRYAHVGLKPNLGDRMDHVCARKRGADAMLRSRGR